MKLQRSRRDGFRPKVVQVFQEDLRGLALGVSHLSSSRTWLAQQDSHLTSASFSFPQVCPPVGLQLVQVESCAHF